MFETAAREMLTSSLDRQRCNEEKKGRYKMKTLKKILNWFVFALTGKGDFADEMVEAGLIDYSGQGRDKYGK